MKSSGSGLWTIRVADNEKTTFELLDYAGLQLQFQWNRCAKNSCLFTYFTVL